MRSLNKIAEIFSVFRLMSVLKLIPHAREKFCYEDGIVRGGNLPFAMFFFVVVFLPLCQNSNKIKF